MRHVARRGGVSTDEALRRVSPRRRRERRRREREGGRDPEHRAELPRVPCVALFRAEAGRNLSGRGGFDRTAARRRICIRQAAAWTEKPPAQKGEHGCPKQSRTLSGKHAHSITTVRRKSIYRGGFASSRCARPYSRWTYRRRLQQARHRQRRESRRRMPQGEKRLRRDTPISRRSAAMAGAARAGRS